MLDILLKSNLLGVLIGGIISLLSIYSVEIFKSKKEDRKEQQRTFHQFVSEIHHFRRIALLSVQTSLLFDLHKCKENVYTIDSDDKSANFQKEEAQRRLQQHEEFQIKRIEVEKNLFSELAKYFIHVGKDTYVRELMNQVEEWEPDFFSSEFKNVTSIDGCMQVYENCEKQIDYIDSQLKELKENFIDRIGNQLNAF